MDEDWRSVLYISWRWHNVSRWSRAVYWKTWSIHSNEWWCSEDCSWYGMWGRIYFTVSLRPFITKICCYLAWKFFLMFTGCQFWRIFTSSKHINHVFCSKRFTQITDTICTWKRNTGFCCHAWYSQTTISCIWLWLSPLFSVFNPFYSLQ